MSETVNLLLCKNLDDAKTEWNKVMPNVKFDENLVRIMRDLLFNLIPLTKMSQDDLEVLANTNVNVYQLGWELTQEDAEMVIKQSGRVWSHNQRQSELNFIREHQHKL